MQFMNASLAFIPNNKNVTFLMGNRCKMMMMMIAKLLTCRVLFKKYNGPYHLLLTSYIHTFVDVLYKKYHHHLLHFILTSSSPSFFSFLLFRVCKAPKNASDFKNRLAAIHSQRSDDGQENAPIRKIVPKGKKENAPIFQNNKKQNRKIVPKLKNQ